MLVIVCDGAAQNQKHSVTDKHKSECDSLLSEPEVAHRNQLLLVRLPTCFSPALRSVLLLNPLRPPEKRGSGRTALGAENPSYAIACDSLNISESAQSRFVFLNTTRMQVIDILVSTSTLLPPNARV